VHETFDIADKRVENSLGHGTITTFDSFEDTCAYKSEVKPEVLASNQLLQLFKRVIKSHEFSTYGLRGNLPQGAR
jgi:hypothetical protein